MDIIAILKKRIKETKDKKLKEALKRSLKVSLDSKKVDAEYLAAMSPAARKSHEDFERKYDAKRKEKEKRIAKLESKLSKKELVLREKIIEGDLSDEISGINAWYSMENLPTLASTMEEGGKLASDFNKKVKKCMIEIMKMANNKVANIKKVLTEEEFALFSKYYDRHKKGESIAPIPIRLV
jgi:hypothetical protein